MIWELILTIIPPKQFCFHTAGNIQIVEINYQKNNIMVNIAVISGMLCRVEE